MEQKKSKVYQYVDGINDLPFPNSTNQLEIKEFTYDAKRMGGAPTISASVKYPTCLDDLWTGKEYVDFRGEKYIIKQTPSSSYSNEDSRYNHEMTFVSERIILDNTYFYDVVTDPTDVDKYVSNSSKVIFFGDIHEFAKRLDYSLKYSKVGYTVVVDEGISTGGFTMSFEDQFFSQVLQSIFDIYGIPYYFVGKVIHIGYTNNAITRTFKYGVDDALLSISKTNANYKIVNRITGAGSPDNIPYYYPNPSEDRAAIEAAGGKWITPSDKLMPPIYRESLGAERFYNAENGTYKDPITGEYYIFENEYVDGNPKEHKVSFDHIKPTIKEMVNAAGLRIDMFEAFDYDANDNDDTDAEGNYLHPYFFGKLRKFDGVNGFNLFDHAIEEDEMIISMTSGSCGACNFVIGVDDDTPKNPVQVHTNGELLRDKDGNVIRSGKPQDIQQNTQTNSVWIALRKDEQTFGVLMPNATNNYKPNALTDTFVILHIDLPQAYITSAENKLKEEIIKYMATNNSDKFNFSINFSRIFFAENPDILSQLNENARLQIEYNKKLYELYISSYSYKMSSNEPLPQITVELSDTLTINKGTLQTSIDAVKQDIMSSVGGNVDFLKQGLKYFVRKDVRDYAKFIDFREGIDVGGFESLISGGTFRKDIDGKSYIEVDRLYVRLKAIFDNLEIKRTTYVGGEQIASPAAMKCIKVEDKEIIVDTETEEETIIVWDYYRCYYLSEQEGVKIQNEFVIGDQAICKEANIASGSNVSNQYYWRLVTGVGDGYIDLSKSDCDTGSTVPAAGDDIVQLGNRNDATRQKAIIQSTVSLDAPSIKLLAGINSFSLDGKAIISMGFDSLTGKATFNVYGNAYIGNPDGSSFIKYTPEGGVEINAKLSIGTTIGDDNETVIDKINQAKQDAIDASNKELTDYAAIVTKDIEGLQNQMDGAIETWFEDPVPTLTNKPAVDWTTVELKNQHLGDLYYSAEGKAYRFQMNGTAYVWQVLSDSDITKALAEAKKAQDTADGKRKVFVRQPLNTDDYDVGDLWVNATFSTIYSNDLLRCKTAKTVNQAFNIVHWELASKYTDDTKAEEAEAAAKKAQDDLKETNKNVEELNLYIDGAFSDGIITEAEAIAIEKYKNTINETIRNTNASYIVLYNNPYLVGASKDSLKVAFDSLETSVNILLQKIETAIADGKTTVEEKNEVDIAYATFNDKIAIYSTAVENANEAIQGSLKSLIDATNNKIDGYSYIKDALDERTTIEGGLILSSLLSLGQTIDEVFTVRSGLNGVFDATKPGNGISYWAGGAMKDLAEDYPLPWQPNNPPKPSDPSKYAKSVVRMDGTVYFAGGNMWIDIDGKIHCDPLSFFVGEEQVGQILTLFTPITTGTGSSKKVVGARQNHPFEDGTGKGRLLIGKHILSEDSNGYLSLTKSDGTPANFYTSGGFSALGLSPDIGGGGGGGGSEYLRDLKDVSLSTALIANDVLMFNGTNWINTPSSSISGSSDWNDLTNKPSWIGASKPSYTKAEVGLGSVDNTSDTDKNVLSATKLAITRTLWGQSFNGTDNVTGTITNCSGINGGGSAITIGNVGNNAYINIIEDIRQPSDNWKITVAGAASFASLIVSNTITGSINGNAASANVATKLATARTINGTSFNGTSNITTSYWGTSRTFYINDASGSNYNTYSVDGSGSVNMKLPNIMTGFSSITSTNFYGNLSGTASTANNSINLGGYNSSEYLRSFWSSANANDIPESSQVTFTYANNAPFNGVLADFSIRHYGIQFNTNYYSDTQLAYRRHAPSSDGGIGSWQYLARTTDNVASATKLATARNINGTSFNGTANITTANWGTARTLSAGTDCSGSVSVNGSGNFTLPITVNTATKLRTARSIWGQSFNGTGNVDGMFRSITGVGNTDVHRILTNANAPYGLITHISSNGGVIMQSQREGNDSQLFSLFLNPKGGAVHIGTWSGSQVLNVGGWISTIGNRGWYSDTYGGGIYMTDTTYVRVSHSKKFIVENGSWDTITSYGGFATAASSGNAWANGYGAINVGIHNNSNQTPLIVAYRNTYSGTTTGSNRLFSAELLNDGSRFRMFFRGNYRFEFDSSGNFVSQGGVTALASASDIRLKQDLTEYSALPLINNLRSVAYKWNEVAKDKSDIFNNDEWQFGLIAQELQAMFPLFVKDVFGDYLTIDYERLIPVCWRGIQELSEISNKHESRLDKLERENRELKKEVKQLKEKSYGKD